MAYWLVGAGGVGCAVGGRLAQSLNVVFIDSWREHVDAINHDGLRIDYAKDPIAVRVPAFYLSEMGRISDPPTAVLLAVKSYQTAETCDAILPYLMADTPVVSLQNCINEEVIAQKVGEQRTIGAICLFDGALIGPGHAMQRKVGGRLVIGELNGDDSSRIQLLRQQLTASMPVDVTFNIWGELWSKLTRNTMINAVTAATGEGIGKLVLDPTARGLCVRLGAEAIRVALAQQMQLVRAELYGHDPEDFLQDPRTATFAAVEDSFKKAYEHHPELKASMLQDVIKGRRTEIEYMNGHVVRKGEELGVATPLNREMVRLVKEIENGDRLPNKAIIGDHFAAMIGNSPR